MAGWNAFGGFSRQTFTKDDFPALGSQPHKDPLPHDAIASSATTSDAPDKLQQHRSSLLGAMRTRQINAPPNLSLMSGPPALSPTKHVAAAAAAGVSAPAVPPPLQERQNHPSEQDHHITTEQDRYGLRGLLSKPTPDASLLALGSYLTGLGLKLGGDDSRLLSSLWSSPWSDTPTLSAMHSDWRLPSCYTSEQMPQILPPAGLKIGNFAEETLFYIFYTQPRDRLQELAAQELTGRNWRYHKSLGLWLTKEPGVEPAVRTPVMERGQYVFFDYERWEKVKKPFELYYEDLEDRFQNQPGGGGGASNERRSSPAGQHPPVYPMASE